MMSMISKSRRGGWGEYLYRKIPKIRFRVSVSSGYISKVSFSTLQFWSFWTPLSNSENSLREISQASWTWNRHSRWTLLPFLLAGQVVHFFTNNPLFFVKKAKMAGLCKLQGYCNLDKLLKLLWAVTSVSSVTEVTFLLNRIAANCIKVKLKCCNFCKLQHNPVFWNT